MRILILQPGLLSTLQDMGRRMFLSQAVPRSGAMDTLSARIANKAVGNEDNAAVIEFTYAGAEFKAETDLLIAYAGDGAFLLAAGLQLRAERPLFIPAGTIIKLANNPMGCRTYLSVIGGWDVPEVLSSRSTYLTAAFGGYQGRALNAGDVIGSAGAVSGLSAAIFKQLKSNTIHYPDWSVSRTPLLPADRKSIRVVPSREFTWFAGESIIRFLSAPYTLDTRCNRMGYHLKGPAIGTKTPRQLLSTAVTPGTIQVTGDGCLVILMADCQTTGGYPRIAQVAAVDMPLCAQLKPGDSIYFKEISSREAEMLYLESEYQLTKLAAAVSSRFL